MCCPLFASFSQVARAVVARYWRASRYWRELVLSAVGERPAIGESFGCQLLAGGPQLAGSCVARCWRASRSWQDLVWFSRSWRELVVSRYWRDLVFGICQGHNLWRRDVVPCRSRVGVVRRLAWSVVCWHHCSKRRKIYYSTDVENRRYCA